MAGLTNFYRHQSHFLNHRLPIEGKDPNLLFANKKHDRIVSEAMRENFHNIRGVHRMDVPIIYDPTIIFVTQELVCKLLKKCRKNQVSIGVIALTEKCVEGVLMNWVPFLLN